MFLTHIVGILCYFFDLFKLLERNHVLFGSQSYFFTLLPLERHLLLTPTQHYLVIERTQQIFGAFDYLHVMLRIELSQ